MAISTTAFGMCFTHEEREALAPQVMGALHGTANFALRTVQGYHMWAFQTGINEMDFTPAERRGVFENIGRSHYNQSVRLNSFLQTYLPYDQSDPVYQSWRSGTEIGLQVASIATAVYGGVKIGANLASAEMKFSRISSINFEVKLNRFHYAAKNLTEGGQNNIRILRGWAKSHGWEKMPNPHGGPEKWGVYQNNKFEWRLVIKPEASFRPGLHEGSNIPRFDARLLTDLKGQSYINPFRGEIGDWRIGTHLPLESNY